MNKINSVSVISGVFKSRCRDYTLALTRHQLSDIIRNINPRCIDFIRVAIHRESGILNEHTFELDDDNRFDEYFKVIEYLLETRFAMREE